MADIKFTVDTSELSQAIRTTEQTKTAVSSLGKVFARTNDASAYMRSINQIVAAQKRLEPAARMTRQEIMRLGAAARQQAQFMAELNRVTSAAGIGMNRYGVITQQAGYQVGDFIVQVQSGTNAFVAFGQQATQVAGTLTLLGGKWIGIGTALGIAIPLVTAIAAGFMRAGREAEEAADQVSEFESVIESLDSTLQDWIRTREAARLGVTVDELLGTQSLEQAQEDLRTAREELERLTERVTGARLAGGSAFGLGGNSEAFTQALQAVADAEERLANIRNMETEQERLEIAERTQELLERGRQAQLDRNREQMEADRERRAIAEAQVYTEELRTNIQQRGVELLEQRREISARIREEQERIAELVEQEESRLARQIYLQRIILQYGENSEAASRHRAAYARDEYEERLRAQGVYGDQLRTLMALYDEQVALTEETEETNRVLREITGVSTDSVVQQIMNIAEALGVSTEAAIALRQALPGTSDGGVSGPDAAMAQTQEEFGLQSSIVFQRTYRARPGGGGGGGGRSYTDIISEMEREVQQRLEILRLSERQQRVREIELEILNQIEGEVDAVTAAEIRGAAERINAIEMQVSELERLREQQEHLAQTIGNAFGDAMTSIITGTEDAGDAFRNMARRIVAELFDVLVVQRMVANLTQAIGGIGGGSSGGGGGFLGNLLGGLFGGRASGGTMNANQPYLVGERGPEIVMPGRQSTVMNSNLSSQAMGGTQQVDVRVFVDDNGNFDAKVERISSNTVRSAAPAIVQQSVGAVVDQRRRGGAMKGVFG